MDLRGCEGANGMGPQVRCKLRAGSENEADADRCECERGAGGFLKCVCMEVRVVYGEARNGKEVYNGIGGLVVGTLTSLT